MNTSAIQELIHQRDFLKAEKVLREAILLEPDSADLIYIRGMLKSHQGKINESIDDLRHALSIDSKHIDAAVCLSVIYNDLGRYDEAKKLFEIANQNLMANPKLEPENMDRRFALKHYELGDLYYRHRRFDEAIEEYNKAINRDPLNLDYRIRRAKAYAKKGYLMRAIQELQQLKLEQPNNNQVKIQLGLLHFSQGNPLDAELEWESVLEKDPTSREALAYLELSKSKKSNQLDIRT